MKAIEAIDGRHYEAQRRIEGHAARRQPQGGSCAGEQVREFGLDLVADSPARALVRVFTSHDAGADTPTIALVEQSLGTFDPALYATSIASEICRREALPFEQLLLITRDRFRFERVADWTILLGPLEMMAQQQRVLHGTEETEAFDLVAFDVEAGALVRPRRTPLSRADVEEIVGSPI